MKDLTRTKECKAVGTQLEPIVKNITKYNLEELKKKLFHILDDPQTSVSPMKANEYKSYAHRIYRLDMMQQYITNIYLAAANISMKRGKRK